MRIMGIDPGYGIVGYGFVEYDHGKFTPVKVGTITTPSDMEFYKRLRVIYLDMQKLIEHYRPDEIAVEKLFFNTNITTGIDVAQARGVTLLPAVMMNLPIYDYTPLQVKSSITGYGYAEKKQVQEMVRSMLHLANIIKPDDAADAMAIAITHGLSVNTRRLMEKYDKSINK
ncbi:MULTISPECIES: crossover junction endodeoxyribonuclease RuvC [Ruminococcus]|jgi:crossover junction endodeoxyribonuclease RuvC|uniref:Crossover junction endodeoxyribonuclease RuvC n=1 Tax=Ruminococcus albus 8 TaxID=246199 RepID=E9SB32_RUMAL|nr:MULTISPECIES: crossover junction endodeoxyribonuclease RuvC [Ruminococcus]EGC03670.1 crossover junction endodeoxyribonuclease RuvC [Ruminococcus albus 8]MBE6872506.1 crossover junction endodeoxyribonuclease RuvC [Ruminococcus albus]MBR0528349.1 crossover junction endodeoxyribonuclease RuvC [Ruminococcus sp.]MCC3349995.1 crossover junction endodeoxyribonuclease RuvC [Ruminococcus albus 8]